MQQFHFRYAIRHSLLNKTIRSKGGIRIQNNVHSHKISRHAWNVLSITSITSLLFYEWIFLSFEHSLVWRTQHHWQFYQNSRRWWLYIICLYQIEKPTLTKRDMQRFWWNCHWATVIRDIQLWSDLLHICFTLSITQVNADSKSDKS